MRTLLVCALCALIMAFVWWHARPNDAAVTAQLTESASLPQTESEETGATTNAATAADSVHSGQHSDCEIRRRYVPTLDGATVATLSCTPVADEPHPYEHYSNKSLESLAYADAEAAEMLGMRLIEDDSATSLSLVVRAAALAGGDSAPLKRYSNAYPHPVYVNGKPQRKTVRHKYVLASVIALLGDDSAAAIKWERVIRTHSSDPDQELTRLQARARGIVAEMRQIQIEVTGTSSIGGAGDA